MNIGENEQNVLKLSGDQWERHRKENAKTRHRTHIAPIGVCMQLRLQQADLSELHRQQRENLKCPYEYQIETHTKSSTLGRKRRGHALFSMFTAMVRTVFCALHTCSSKPFPGKCFCNEKTVHRCSWPWVRSRLKKIVFDASSDGDTVAWRSKTSPCPLLRALLSLSRRDAALCFAPQVLHSRPSRPTRASENVFCIFIAPRAASASLRTSVFVVVSYKPIFSKFGSFGTFSSSHDAKKHDNLSSLSE